MRHRPHFSPAFRTSAGSRPNFGCSDCHRKNYHAWLASSSQTPLQIFLDDHSRAVLENCNSCSACWRCFFDASQLIILISIEKRIIVYLILVHTMMLSLLLGTNIVQVKLTNGQEAQGEFIGIYMDHIHILKDEKLYYYACDKILAISSPKKDFSYDCNKNTVTADILFPPELDPMTGKWVQRLPDLFNLNIIQPEVSKEISGINDDPTKMDLDKIESRFDDEVPTFDEINFSEQDFIMINGVKYIRSVLDEETEFPAVSIEDVIYQAKQTAKQMERRSFNQFLGAGSCLFSSIGVPVSILYVEFAESRMDPGNPFYFELDPSLKVEYERYYKKEEKRLLRKRVYGTQGSCLLLLIGWISLNVAFD